MPPVEGRQTVPTYGSHSSALRASRTAFTNPAEHVAPRPSSPGRGALPALRSRVSLRPGNGGAGGGAPVRSRRMDLRRLRAGEWIAGVSGLVLLVALFLPWYAPGSFEGVSSGTGPVSVAARTGWESLGALDVVLAVVALSALAIPVVTAFHRVPAVPLAHQSLTVLVGGLALLLVLVRVLNMPDWAVEREWGLWVALVATLGITAGALVAMRDERLTSDGRHTDLTGVPVAQQLEVETLPAPRPEAGR
jgi:hypothetical protein